VATAAEPVASPRRRRSGLSERRLAALMIAPALLVIVLVAAYPIVYAIWLSLHEYSLIHQGLSRWAGFRNYSSALWGVESHAFWSAFKTTFLFTALSVALELVLGLVMALAMHQAFKGRAILRATVLVPWAILTVVTAMTWRAIFDPDLGFANTMLRALHLPGGHVVWLGQSGYALAVLVFADVWKTAPFMALLLLAGLQVIPGDLYEAAAVDGATKLQQFWRITFPLLMPAILVTLIFRTLDALRVFDVFFVFFGNRPDTQTMAIYDQSTIVGDGLVGYGGAISVAIFLIISLFVVIYVTFMRVGEQ
jgi:multiple sugar transport system permease protein